MGQNVRQVVHVGGWRGQTGGVEVSVSHTCEGRGIVVSSPVVRFTLQCTRLIGSLTSFSGVT